jgi:hydrogenase/urease accessory protein HupE
MFKLALIAAAAALAGTGLAEAHPFHTDGSGHALFGIEAALAIVAAGLWAVQLAPRALRSVRRSR